MGSSVSINFQHLYTRRLNTQPNVLCYMPSYYQHVITKSDLQRCKQHWDMITQELIPPNSENEGIGELYDSNKSWLYSLLSEGITETILAESSFRAHPFLSKMLEIINLSLSQWNHLAEFQRQTILLSKECCNYGIKHQDFIDFGPILFNALSVVSKSYDATLDHAWKSLYSSILSIIIPYCIEFGDMVTVPAEGLVVNSPSLPTGFESKPISNDPPPQTSSPRAKVSAASARLRMNTSISNAVQL